MLLSRRRFFKYSGIAVASLAAPKLGIFEFGKSLLASSASPKIFIVELFGLTFSLSVTKKFQEVDLSPYPHLEGMLQVNFDGLGWLRVQGKMKSFRTHTLDLDLAFTMVQFDDEIWRPTEGVHEFRADSKFKIFESDLLAENPPEEALAIIAGGFNIREKAFIDNEPKKMVVKKGVIGFEVQKLNGIFWGKEYEEYFKELPLDFNQVDISLKILSIQLKNMFICIPKGVFRCKVQSPLEVKIKDKSQIIPFFVTELYNEKFCLPLLPWEVAQIPFFPRVPEIPLKIYSHTPYRYQSDGGERNDMGLKGNPVIPGLGIQDYKLWFDVVLVPDIREFEITILRRIYLKPSQDFMKVISYGYGDKQNGSVQWKVSQELDLCVRPGSKGRPATLMISPIYKSGLLLEKLNEGPIHGIAPGNQFFPACVGRLICIKNNKPECKDDIVKPIDCDLIYEMTAPWIQFCENSFLPNRFQHTKPEKSWTKSQKEDIEFLMFQGRYMALPLLAQEAFTAPKLYKDIIDQINYNWFDKQVYERLRDPEERLHESGVREVPMNPLGVREVFIPKILGEPKIVQKNRQVDIRLKENQFEFNYGPIRVELLVTQDYGNPDYFVLLGDKTIACKDCEKEGGKWRFVNAIDFPLDPQDETDMRAKGLPDGVGEEDGANRVIGIIKLTRRLNLKEIFQEIGKNPTLPTGYEDESPEFFFENVLDKTVVSNNWLGIILFQMPLFYEKFTILTNMVSPPLFLSYVALTPQRDPKKHKTFSLNARLMWLNNLIERGSFIEEFMAADKKLEVGFNFLELDVAWYDRNLVHFHSKSELMFKSFLGMPFLAEERPKVDILGSLDRSTNKIQFLGNFGERINLFPGSDFGPFKWVYLKKLVVAPLNKEAKISMSGSFYLQGLNIDGNYWISVEEGISVEYHDLIILLTPPENNEPRKLEVSYPTITYNFDGPHYRFGPMEVKLTSIGVDWEKNKPNFEKMVSLWPLKDETSTYRLPACIVTLQMKLMELPELALKPIDQLIFNFTFGLGLKEIAESRWNWDPSTTRIALSAVAFENLKLDLLRFLVVQADKVEVMSEGHPPTGEACTDSVEGPGPWLAMENVKIQILNATILNNFYLYLFFSPNKEKGFIGFIKEPLKDGGLLTINWALIGKNLTFRDSGLAKDIMRIEAEDRKNVREELMDAYDCNEFLPTTDEKSEWIFAAGFDFFNGLIKGKFLIQDNAYYGLVLGGKFLALLGMNPNNAFSCLYIKGRIPGEDSFLISFRVPAIALGFFNFGGGVVSIQIFVHGGGVLDVGFPKLLQNGARDWTRALSTLVGFIQGSGGFYLRLQKLKGCESGKLLRIGAGYASQGGYGFDWGAGGIFRIYGQIGIYIILEGTFLFEKDRNLNAFQLVGAVGVLAVARLTLNWWIISVEAEALASAEARAALRWGKLDSCQLLPAWSQSRLTQEDIVLDMNLTLNFSLSARACIGSGFCKICKVVEASEDLPVNETLKIGTL